jgi:hypothetical protein
MSQNDYIQYVQSSLDRAIEPVEISKGLRSTFPQISVLEAARALHLLGRRRPAREPSQQAKGADSLMVNSPVQDAAYEAWLLLQGFPETPPAQVVVATAQQYPDLSLGQFAQVLKYGNPYPVFPNLPPPDVAAALVTPDLAKYTGPVTAPALAQALRGVFPGLSAVDMGKTVLGVAAFRDKSKDDLRTALKSAGYPDAEVESALAILFPARPIRIAASQQGGSRGVELWALPARGQISTLYQKTAGGPWSNWEGPGFKGQPVDMQHVAAAQQRNGNVMLFTLDGKGSVWAIGQQRPGGDWAGWSGPSLASQPSLFEKIAACEQGGSRGVELWALGADGRIWTLYQVTAGGAWSKWEGPSFKGQPGPMRHLAAALQNTGNVMLFALDDRGSVWAIGQQQPGGDWGGWAGPGLSGQPHAFSQIVASEQKGTRGVELWALGEDGQIWTLYQKNPGNSWSAWEGPGFKAQPKPMRQIAAALQNTGNAMLFAVDDEGQLWSIGQQKPGGDWGGWTLLPGGSLLRSQVSGL